jgi:hypothetical protein
VRQGHGGNQVQVSLPLLREVDANVIVYLYVFVCLSTFFIIDRIDLVTHEFDC